MKKLQVFTLALPFVASLLFMLPFVLAPAFNIIDDGASLYVAEKLKNTLTITNWTETLVEKEVGRFRPMYHITFFIIYSVFGLNPLPYWLMQWLILGFTLYLMSIFLYKITNHRIVSFGLPLLMLFIVPTVENFYRLGTAEPKQMFIWTLLLLSFVYLKQFISSKKMFFLSVLLFSLSLLMKETSITFVLFYYFFATWNFIFNKNTKVESGYIILLPSIIVLMFLSGIPSAQGYSSNFNFNFNTIWYNLLLAKLEHAVILFPLSIAGISVAARYLTSKYLLKKPLGSFFWQLMLLTQLIGILVIGILPWGFQLGRYFYPVYIIALLIIGLEMVECKNYLKKIFSYFEVDTKYLFVIICFLLLFLIQKEVFQSSLGLITSIQTLKQNLFIFLFENKLLLLCIFCLTIFSFFRQFLKLKHLKSNFIDEEFLASIILPITELAFIFISFFIWQQNSSKSLYIIYYVTLVHVYLEYVYWKKLSINTKYSIKIEYFFLLPFSIIFLFLIGMNTFIFKNNITEKNLSFKDVLANQKQSFDVHQVSYGLINTLINNTNNEERIFVSSNDYEIIFEIGLYASRLKTRSIKIFTNNTQLIADLGNTYTYLQYVDDPIGAFKNDSHHSSLLLRKNDWEKLRDSDTYWAGLTAQELPPRKSFGTVPESAYWVKISKN